MVVDVGDREGIGSAEGEEGSEVEKSHQLSYNGASSLGSSVFKECLSIEPSRNPLFCGAAVAPNMLPRNVGLSRFSATLFLKTSRHFLNNQKVEKHFMKTGIQSIK